MGSRNGGLSLRRLKGTKGPRRERADLKGGGQPRAAEHTQHHLAALDQAQRDGILVVAQEALGPVHGIQRLLSGAVQVLGLR